MISGKTRQPSEDAYGGSHAGVPPPTRPRPPQTIPRRSAPCPRYSTRHRRPTPLRISTRPRGAEASTIWSTIYAIRCHQLVRVFRTMPLAARWGKDTAYTTALVRIAALYAIEADIRGLAADERRQAQQRRTKPLVDSLARSPACHRFRPVDHRRCDPLRTLALGRSYRLPRFVPPHITSAVKRARAG